MWMEWAGWNFVSALLTAIGLLALAFAAGDIYRRRRRISPVELVVDDIGRAVFNDEPVEVLEITNNGSEDLRILTWGFVGAEPRVTLEYRVPRRLGAGESARFTVVSPDLSTAWMLLCWRSLDDKRWFQVRWLPLLPSRKWTAILQAQRRSVPKRRWWQVRVRRLPIEPVSPWTIEQASVRANGRHRELMDKRLETAVSAVRARGGELYSHGRIIDVTEDASEVRSGNAPGGA